MTVLNFVAGLVTIILGLIMLRDPKRAAERSARIPGVAKSWTSPSVWISSGLLLIVTGALAVGVAVFRLMGWLGE